MGLVVNREKSHLKPTSSDNPEYRIHSSFLGAGDQAHRREGSSDNYSVQEGTSQEISFCPPLGQNNKQDNSNQTSCTHRPLWYRELQQLKNNVMQTTQSIRATMVLNQEALLKLIWWSSRVNLLNGSAIWLQKQGMIVETDVSMLGWGAVNNGVQTGGLWSQTEVRNLINYLKFTAAFLR